MFSIVRSVRAQTPSILFPSYPQKVISKASTVRFAQAASGPAEESDGMDKQSQEPPKTEKGDTMSHSFGEGYATRSEEEGFGGVYPPNQSLTKEDEHVHDKDQGSEVKEKEGGGNQSKPES